MIATVYIFCCSLPVQMLHEWCSSYTSSWWILPQKIKFLMIFLKMWRYSETLGTVRVCSAVKGTWLVALKVVDLSVPHFMYLLLPLYSPPR